MIALVKWRTATAGGAREERLGEVRFFDVSIRRGDGMRSAWSARRAARTLQKRGIRQAVFPENFPFYERFARCGIRPADDLALRCAAASEIVRCAMRQRGIAPESATLALCAQQVTREVARAAEQLAGEIRYLKLCVPHGGWELSQHLRSRFGAAVPVEDKVAEADVVLCFDTFRPLSAEHALVLPLADARLRIEYRLPKEYGGGAWDEVQLAAALFSSMALGAEQIEVAAVRFADDDA